MTDYFGGPCTMPGHRYGCPGKAGGLHELNLPAHHLSDDIRLEVGRLVFDKFINGSPWNGTREDATYWLETLGFDQIEWLDNEDGDILILSISRFALEPTHRVLDEFIIKYSGHDAANIALFNLVKEVSL